MHLCIIKVTTSALYLVALRFHPPAPKEFITCLLSTLLAFAPLLPHRGCLLFKIGFFSFLWTKKSIVFRAEGPKKSHLLASFSFQVISVRALGRGRPPPATVQRQVGDPSVSQLRQLPSPVPVSCPRQLSIQHGFWRAGCGRAWQWVFWGQRGTESGRQGLSISARPWGIREAISKGRGQKRARQTTKRLMALR